MENKTINIENTKYLNLNKISDMEFFKVKAEGVKNRFVLRITMTKHEDSRMHSIYFELDENNKSNTVKFKPENYSGYKIYISVKLNLNNSRYYFFVKFNTANRTEAQWIMSSTNKFVYDATKDYDYFMGLQGARLITPLISSFDDDLLKLN
jgi:hypothetical protein